MPHFWVELLLRNLDDFFFLMVGVPLCQTHTVSGKVLLRMDKLIDQGMTWDYSTYHVSHGNMRIRLYHLCLLCNVPLKWLLASYLYSSHRQEFQWCPHGLFVLWRLYTIKEEVLPQTQMKVCLLAGVTNFSVFLLSPNCCKTSLVAFPILNSSVK